MLCIFGDEKLASLDAGALTRVWLRHHVQAWRHCQQGLVPTVPDREPRFRPPPDP
jgi:hypothetical protein